MTAGDKGAYRGEVRNMKKKKKSALWRRLALAALGIILGINAYLANARGLAGNQMPTPFGFGAAVVLSGSMEPTLKTNDMIIVRETGSYEVGDIVVYQSGNTLIVHRVIAKDGETVTTQGDANNVADDPIAVSVIKGEVIAHIPAAGLVVNALKTPVGILIVLLAAFALTELSFRKEKDKDEKELEAIKEEIRRLKEEQNEKK